MPYFYCLKTSYHISYTLCDNSSGILFSFFFLQSLTLETFYGTHLLMYYVCTMDKANGRSREVFLDMGTKNVF